LRYAKQEERNLRSPHHFAALRRYEAAGWLRKTVGVVGGKDLPAEPSEEDFRLGLRSGIILCNVLNKVQSGAVPKVWFRKVFIFFSTILLVSLSVCGF
jgi:hypothetical protein